MHSADLIREINSGIYVFHTTALFHCLDQLKNDNSAGEFYLTDVAALLVQDGDPVVAVAADSVDEVLGANTIAEMMHLDASMRHATAHRLMASGVTIFRPDTVVIDASVTVGPDTVLEPFTQLLGNTRVGSGCHIRSYSVVQDSTLGDNVLLRNGCILDHATVGDGALLGPYAHLRPDSRIGKAAHVGNFVETKKTILGAGSKANHLSLLRRRRNRRAREHRCRCDHLQLRRGEQNCNHYRRRCFRRLRFDLGRPCHPRQRQLRRRRQLHHARPAAGLPRYWPIAASYQGGLGPEPPGSREEEGVSFGIALIRPEFGAILR